MKEILGKKLTMSQAETSDGRRVAITRIQAGPIIVTAIKNKEKDGYDAVQVGFGERKRSDRPTAGHLKNSKSSALILKEIQIDQDVNVGDEIKIADVFQKGDVVDVTSQSKGKGFAGGIKRHHFHGGPKTHGQSDRHRAPGSIGSTTTPGRVMKGKRMAGRMGASQITVQGLEIIDLIPEENLVLVKGAVPGYNGTILVLRKSSKKRKVYHGPQAQALPHKDSEEAAAAVAEGTIAASPAAAPAEGGTSGS